MEPLANLNRDTDPAFYQAFEALASLPRAERNAVIAFVLFWIQLSAEVRAVIVKLVRPEMRDMDVARLAGISRWALNQLEGYRRLKPTLVDFARIEGRGCKRRKSQHGTWPLLDNPDEE